MGEEKVDLIWGSKEESVSFGPSLSLLWCYILSTSSRVTP